LRLEHSYELNLWEDSLEGQARSIVAPVDPAEVGIDPLALI
jgi:hypothetical protein